MATHPGQSCTLPGQGRHARAAARCEHGSPPCGCHTTLRCCCHPAQAEQSTLPPVLSACSYQAGGFETAAGFEAATGFEAAAAPAPAAEFAAAPAPADFSAGY